MAKAKQNRSPKINPVDAYIGQRLRFARALHGLSQTTLASVGNISCQQIQKYEKGSNRISVSLLYQLAGHLHFPVSWFLEWFSDNEYPTDTPEKFILHDRETYRLIGLFQTVEDRKHRKIILEIVESAIELL